MADGPTPAQRGIFAQILDYENRANPYPLYAQLRRTPVAPRRTAPSSSARIERSLR